MGYQSQNDQQHCRGCEQGGAPDRGAWCVLSGRTGEGNATEIRRQNLQASLNQAVGSERHPSSVLTSAAVVAV